MIVDSHPRQSCGLRGERSNSGHLQQQARLSTPRISNEDKSHTMSFDRRRRFGSGRSNNNVLALSGMDDAVACRCNSTHEATVGSIDGGRLNLQARASTQERTSLHSFVAVIIVSILTLLQVDGFLASIS